MEPKLTEREKEVKELVIQGFTNGQIAEKLFVTKDTINHHVHMILSKYELDNRMQIAYFELKMLKAKIESFKQYGNIQLEQTIESNKDNFNENLKLTNRENEVKELVIQGFTNGQIAKKLIISRHTVTHYVCEILKKLEVNNRMQIAYYEIKKLREEIKSLKANKQI